MSKIIYLELTARDAAYVSRALAFYRKHTAPMDCREWTDIERNASAIAELLSTECFEMLEDTECVAFDPLQP